MNAVSIAMAPGLLVQAMVFGPGVALQIASCVATAVLIHRLKRVPGYDAPGLVTALLIGAALPPLAPWWLGVAATAIGIGLCREVYGGVGANLFNPAMAGYAAVLIAFPAELARWPEPWSTVWGFGAWLGFGSVDGMTAATTLEALRFSAGATEAELFAGDTRFGTFGGSGWELICGSWVLGGLWLLRQKVITWHAPLGLLVGLGTAALAGADAGSSAGHGSATLHLLSGGAMLAAFFIVTDPVTSPVERSHQFWWALAIGVVIWLIRAHGHYADGVAFAVLLANAVVPLLDRIPRRGRHSLAPTAPGEEPAGRNNA